MAQWAKVSPDVQIAAPTKPSPAPRTKTDKNHKCQVIKKSGANAGQPCGANCVVGKETCSRHSEKKEEKKEEKVAPAGVPAGISAGSIPDDAALKAMTVVKLKELAKVVKVTISSKARKDDIISELVKARTKSSSPPPQAAPVEEDAEHSHGEEHSGEEEEDAEEIVVEDDA